MFNPQNGMSSLCKYSSQPKAMMRAGGRALTFLQLHSSIGSLKKKQFGQQRTILRNFIEALSAISSEKASISNLIAAVSRNRLVMSHIKSADDNT
jgi:hypothetical protein